MGCASSKRTEAARVDIYRPPPSSFAVFDINSIDEPWLVIDKADKDSNAAAAMPTARDNPPETKLSSHVPSPILEKLHTLESTDTPHSWVEVSKALEDLKPSIHDDNKKDTGSIANPTRTKPSTPPQIGAEGEAAKKSAPPRKSSSFHTVEELDEKLSATKPAKNELRKTESMRTETNKKVEPRAVGRTEPGTAPEGARSVKHNIFVVRDRLEREKEGKMAIFDQMMSKRDPLSEFPEKCPPRGADSLVIYTTSLRGVRRTFEDCACAKDILEIHRVVFDERDVALHGAFRSELRELIGEGESVPRVFLKGRYLGGLEELVELNESGRFGKLLRAAHVEKGPGRLACDGCGGARFVPCLDCRGSCKVVVGDGKRERCGKCNENGLVHCPVCL